jgi:hypothetical protein
MLLVSRVADCPQMLNSMWIVIGCRLLLLPLVRCSRELGVGFHNFHSSAEDFTSPSKIASRW